MKRGLFMGAVAAAAVVPALPKAASTTPKALVFSPRLAEVAAEITAAPKTYWIRLTYLSGAGESVKGEPFVLVEVIA
jgi:hypothetical protein